MTSGIPVTDSFVVERVTVDGKEYGSLVIPDLYYEDCNTIIISSDRCDCTYLSSMPISAGVNLEDDEFIALTQTHHGLDRGTVLVNLCTLVRNCLLPTMVSVMLSLSWQTTNDFVTLTSV